MLFEVGTSKLCQEKIYLKLLPATSTAASGRLLLEEV